MTDTNPQKIKEILSRGVEDVIVRDELEKKLLSEKKLRIYLGIDPTGANLHLGHVVVLWKLRDFQDLGHEVILLIGDFTARIGDPSGRDTTRKPLTERGVKDNFKNYKKQASKILDFSKVKIKYNNDWLSKLKFEDILKLAANFTVQQMIQRDMFQRRLNENLPISLQEFMYPLLQGYDSVAMNVDLEIGGNDQMFNMLVGRTLQKIYNGKDKDVLTTKLLMGLDGKKMSKTFDNFVAIDDKPSNMYGKLMSMKDELIDHYFELATRLSLEEISQIKKSSDNPRDIKVKLAKEIVKMYHSEKDAEMAEQEFNKVHRDRELPTNIPIFQTDQNSYSVLDLLCDTKLASSKNEAKRLVEAGAVDFDSITEKDWKKSIDLKDGMIIKVGSRKFIKIKIK